jgi:hypothetical protein
MSDGDFDPDEISPFVTDTGAGDQLPYPGLRPFKKSERRFFFGRSEHIAEIVEILAKRSHFVTAIGPSGCGKSSLIRAGVQPALEFGLIANAGQRWVSTKMRPGDAPLAHLRDAFVEVTHGDAARALSDLDQARLKAMLAAGRDGLARFLAEHPLPAGHRLLLLVDQFEELFRYEVARADAESFVALLVELFREPLEQVFVILTMRTDYIGDCTRFLGLAEVINQTFYLIPPLDRAQLTDAIANPATVVGGHVHESLVEQLLQDMYAVDDALPLVQHVLMWMWIRALERRARSSVPDAPIELTLADYHDRAVDGLSLALSHHADHIIDSPELVPEAWRNAELLFRQLVQRDESRFIRRPIKVSEIIASTGGDEDARPLLDLATLRPLVAKLASDDCGFVYVQTETATGEETPELSEDSTIDIGHEALIRQWRALRDWARSEADAGERMQTLAKEALEWQAKQRGLLDRLALASYRQAWSALKRLHALSDREHGAFPPLRWAARYLTPIARDPIHGGVEHPVPDLYALGRDFWRASRRRSGRRRALQIAGVLAIALVPLLVLLANWLLETRSAFERLESAVAATVDRSRDYGKYRDAPGYRALADSVEADASSIALMGQTAPLALWFGHRIGASRALALDLAAAYRDLADLYGVAGRHWPKQSNKDTAPIPKPVLPRSLSNLVVPIAGASVIKGPNRRDCFALIDAVGELSLACADKDGRIPSAPPPITLRSARGSNAPSVDIDPACFRGRACSPQAIAEWLRISRVAGTGDNGELVAVAPDRSVHRCRVGGIGESLQCDEIVTATRALRGMGDRLLNLALDDRGRWISAILWRMDKAADTERRWTDSQWNGDLFAVQVLDLVDPRQVMIQDYALRTSKAFGSPETVVALWLRRSDHADALILTAAFGQAILQQWVLPMRQTVDAAAIMPRWTAVEPLGKAILGAVSNSGEHIVLTGESRPLAFFSLTGSAERGDGAGTPAAPVGEWTLLTTRPADLKFVDEELIVISDDQANAFLIRFSIQDQQRLDPPPRFELPVRHLIIDRDAPAIYGIAPDREQGTRLLRWDSSQLVQRAARIRVPAEPAGSEDGIISRRQAYWRNLLSALAEGSVAGVAEITAEKSTSASTAGCGGGSLPKRYALSGGRLWISVCDNGTVSLIARTRGRGGDNAIQDISFADLKDPLTGAVNTHRLYCRNRTVQAAGDRPQLPEGCWLVLNSDEVKVARSPAKQESQPTSIDVVYHLPRMSRNADSAVP